MSDWRETDRDQLERHLEHELKKRGLTRRDLMKGGMGMAGALGLGALFAACGGGGEEAAPPATEAAPPATEAAPPATEAAPKFTGTLRVIGLGVDLQAADGRAGAQPGAPIAEEAEKALGFKLEFTVKNTVEMEQIALTQPESFDIFSGYHYQYDRLWPVGIFQPIEIAKIPRWAEINNVHKVGRVDPASPSAG